MYLKKTRLFIFCIPLMALGFTGCLEKTVILAQSSTVTDSITIKAVNWDSSAMPWLPLLIDSFSKQYPTVTIEILDIPPEEYSHKLMVLLNDGSDIDLFWIKDNEIFPQLLAQGHLANLADYANRDRIDLKAFNGLVENFVSWDGLWALPTLTDYQVLFYNRDLFDDAGIKYPSNDMTWNDWEKLANKLSSIWSANNIYGGLLHNSGDYVQTWAVQDGVNSIVAENYEFFKPHYEMALRMREAGFFWEYSSLADSGIEHCCAFLEGKVATMPMNASFINTILDKVHEDNLKLKWGISMLPHPQNREPGWTVGSVVPISINQSSSNKEMAWRFVNFITNNEGAAIYAKNNVIPGRANRQTLKIIADSQALPQGALEALAVKHISLEMPFKWRASEIKHVLGEEHNYIMAGENGIDQGLTIMAMRSKEMLASVY